MPSHKIAVNAITDLRGASETPILRQFWRTVHDCKNSLITSLRFCEIYGFAVFYMRGTGDLSGQQGFYEQSATKTFSQQEMAYRFLVWCGFLLFYFSAFSDRRWPGKHASDAARTAEATTLPRSGHSY